MKSKDIIQLKDKLTNETISIQVIERGTRPLTRFIGNFCYNGLRNQPAFQPKDYTVTVLGHINYDLTDTEKDLGYIYENQHNQEVETIFEEFKKEYGIIEK